MKRVLITGVTGFVGSTLVHYFSGRKDIMVFGHSRDPDSAKRLFSSEAVEIISAEPAGQLDLLAIDCVIHLAGIAHDLSKKFVEADYFRVNFEQTARLYDAFLNSKATKFIYFSSIKAVVDAIDTPFAEDVAPDPATPYGRSKLKAEHYIQEHAAEGKRYYILRPCMIHGKGNKGNLNLLYKFVKSGIPYPLGAFHNKRSLLGADNLSFLVGEFVAGSIASGVYNVADEGSLSTNDIVRSIASALGRRARIWNIPPGAIRFLFRLVGKEKTLAKLVGNMEVSNMKILQAINKSLPVSVDAGLQKTIRSFHE